MMGWRFGLSCFTVGEFRDRIAKKKSAKFSVQWEKMGDETAERGLVRHIKIIAS